ncbi:MAG: glutathione S-transferase family protein [Chloroflexota bacterium]
MASELGLQYNHIPLAFDDPALKKPDFLYLNPAGAIPTIVDSGFALSESLAINLYLAKKYSDQGPTSLYPTSPQTEAEIWRWGLWAQGHLEPWVQKDQLLAGLLTAIGNQADAMIDQSLMVLERQLTTREWLVQEHFTVGDLNMAAVLSPSRAKHLDLSSYPNVDAWLRRCYTRPAALATRRQYQNS